MNVKPIWKIINQCLEEHRYSILKHLEREGQLSYTDLMHLAGFDGRSKKFPYHLRKIRILGLIKLQGFGKVYKLTEKGTEAIKILEDMQELHITENHDEVCINNKDRTHDFTTICKKCGMVRKRVVVTR